MNKSGGRKNWIFGYCEIKLEGQVRKKLLELFLEYPITYWQLSEKQDATVCCILKRDTALFMRECERRKLKANINARSGLPSLLNRYRRRPGIPLGLIIIALSIYISGLFIWEINLSGNERVPDEELYMILQKQGIYTGSFIPPLDLDAVHNRIIIENSDIAWISVNIRGTVANVEVREIQKAENKTTGNAPSNVVAALDGQISAIELYNGQAYVNIGDSVREGQLLISGITTDKHGIERIVHASGRVMAKTNRIITIKIPLV